MAGSFHKTIVFLTSALLLTACGGGSSGGNPASPTPGNPGGGNNDDSPGGGVIPVVQTGTFLDSPVGGIGYRTATQQGVTNTLGHYHYLAGEQVTFFIGDLEFQPVMASGMVTPADIAAGDDVYQTNVCSSCNRWMRMLTPIMAF